MFGFGGAPGQTKANTRTALTIAAFYNGIDMISSDIAMLPKGVYLKDGKTRSKVSDHPVHYLISKRPSKLNNAFDFWKIIIASAIVKGNGYARIIRNESTGLIDSFLFAAHEDVEILESENALFYKHKGTVYSGEDMLHIKGFSLDGKKGIGVVTYAAAQLGVILDSQTFSGDVYRNKGLSFGVAETEKAMTPEAKEKVQSGASKALSSNNPHRVSIFDEGLKYKQISLSPAESQFLETNKAAVGEVARWLNIPLHKLKDLDNANYANIYQQSIEYVQYTLLRWIIPCEQELDVKVFSESEKKMYTKFNVAFLLRGDLDMKQRFYTGAIYSGYMTRNEVRALEEMNPLGGLDEILQPTNLQTLEFMMQQLKDNKDAGNKDQ
jgi:HK97 family phage portal protein